MGSFSKNCEITEAMDEKPAFPRKGPNKILEDNINKLFESVNVKSTKSLDLSDTRRNPSKNPMRGNGPISPVIGFSEPISLKQALRGLCISQAAEMAALKRSSILASPRISEAAKIGNVYKLLETGGHSPFAGREQKMEISVVREETRLNCWRTVKLPTQSHNASPRFGVQSNSEKLENNSMEVSGPAVESSTSDVGISAVERDVAECSSKELPVCILETKKQSKKSSIVHREVENEPAIDVNVSRKGLEKEKCSLVLHDKACDSFFNQEKENASSNKVASVPSKKPITNLKSRKKSRPSAGVVEVKKYGKTSAKSTTRAVKPVIINKNLVIKRPKKASASKDVNRKGAAQQDSSGGLICHKCQCSLSKDSQITNTSIVKTNVTPNIAEKRDISRSSKSSVFDISTSTTTSLSDDSNLSGPTCRNRPHMAMGVRWQAINRVKKQNGFLSLNQFNLLKKLGSGDIGTVYLAELAGTGCLFAIKVMDNEFLVRRKKIARAQTEREILGMLDHPFLPTLYAQFTSDNLSCLVMEFCPGGDLHVLRQKQPGRCFPEDSARFYVAEVLLALEYLHMLGIVYRDLKPENILVREDGHIMLTDFDLSLRCLVNPTLIPSSSLPPPEPSRPSGPCAGSSCIDPFCAGPTCRASCFGPWSRQPRSWAEPADTHRALPQLVVEPTGARSNSFVGTHEYLAPEIIKGEGHGSSVDWWTVGVFLYELLYGRTPFKGSDNEETLSNVVVEGVGFPDAPIVGLRARDLIRRLLVKEPEGRMGAGMGTAEIKRHPFFEGMNWALIRCAAPPWVPGACGGVGGDHVEFQVF